MLLAPTHGEDAVIVPKSTRPHDRLATNR